MPKLIYGSNALDAWKQGVDTLLSSHEQYNLITTISNPTYYSKTWLQDYNPKRYLNGCASLSDVITTIFPYKFLSRKYSREELYSRYLEVIERASWKDQRWGTYFLRLISFGESNINQLETVINSLNVWKSNHKAALVLHLSSANTDSLTKIMGNPCLQYIEILCPDSNTLSLLAVYRNHDFYRKTLGNFIGLGQLQQFICSETGRNPGELTCISAHAYYDVSKAKVVQLSGHS